MGQQAYKVVLITIIQEEYRHRMEAEFIGIINTHRIVILHKVVPHPEDHIGMYIRHQLNDGAHL